MEVSELDYALPDELVAQHPVEPRSDARLLVVGAEPRHHTIRDLPSLLSPSLLVVNDTRVRRARLYGEKASGGRVELLLLDRLTDGDGDGERWSALGRASKPIKEGATLSLEGGLVARVEGRVGPTLTLAFAPAERSVDEVLEDVGHVPLPPYVRRDDTERDRERYQTIFASALGAVAAPTAGLHFDAPLLDALAAAGHRVARVTLHVGPGTFRPVSAARLEDHPMHAERWSVSADAADAIALARRESRPVVAIGTTVVRTLESAHDGDAVRAGEGETRLFIRPGYAFRAIDGLLTNFHLPRSTLLALVMALAGVDKTRAAYAEAVRARYRFYSYGDAMLVPPESIA